VAGVGPRHGIQRAFQERAEATHFLNDGHFAAGQDFHVHKAGGGICGSRGAGRTEKQADAEEKDGKKNAHRASHVSSSMAWHAGANNYPGGEFALTEQDFPHFSGHFHPWGNSMGRPGSVERR
jgi:hypothetical protein